MDYRRMYDDKEHLYAHDLEGREVTVQIEKCTGGELIGERGKKSKKPMLKFVGKEKKLALNKTNGKAVAKLYSKETDNWVGKWITIYPTTTEFGGDVVDCIRVRPEVPQPRTNKNGNGKSSKGGPSLTQEIADKMAEDSGTVASSDAGDHHDDDNDGASDAP